MTPTTHIALVDDHVLLRSGLAALINSFDGYQVLFEADNGEDFIRQVQQHPPPAIVLLDITMPRMNGYETAAWIKANLPDAKVLVLSMMENDTAIIRMIKMGAKGYILKDSKPPTFKEALNSVRDHGFYINELISSRMLHYVSHDGEETPAARMATVPLSDKELAFLKLAATEMTYKEIAGQLFISPRTVDSYRDALFEKLGVSSRVGLVLYAIKQGIVSV